MIEKEAADKLGLESFGELHAAGMVGNVQSCFRRGETLQLGPLTVEKPLMMQISVGGIVRGAPGPVIGIIGCAIIGLLYHIWREPLAILLLSDARG